MLQPFQIKIVYYVVAPAATVCICMSFANIDFDVPSNVKVSTKCGIKVVNRNIIQCFPNEEFISLVLSLKQIYVVQFKTYKI